MRFGKFGDDDQALILVRQRNPWLAVGLSISQRAVQNIYMSFVVKPYISSLR
jgi:hypothetical protein